MRYRTILIDLSAECPVRGRLTVARDLAARFKATLVGLHVVPPPILPVGFYGDMAGYLGAELIAAPRDAQ